MRQKLTREEAQRYWRTVHDASSDDLAAVCFPDRSHRFNRFFDRIQRLAIRRALLEARVDARGAHVLDVGCGRGRWLRFYEAIGGTANGIDVSAAAVAYCTAAGLTARQEGAEAISDPDGSYDIVNVVTVLIHLPPAAQAAAARELVRVCKPGGVVVLLEGTSPDASSHVWSRPVSDWVRLFPGLELVRAESHYFAPLLRALWKSPVGRLPVRFVRALEEATTVMSLPLEFVLMRLYRGRRRGFGLQHVLVLRKPA